MIKNIAIRYVIRWIRYNQRLLVRFIFFFVIAIIFIDSTGLFLHLQTKDFHTQFNYPLDDDIMSYVNIIKKGKTPELPPINLYNYKFLYNAKDKCHVDDNVSEPRLVYVVKSARKNYGLRETIRNTWGFEHRFSDVIIRTVFMIGSSIEADDPTQKLIDLEAENYNDIVQSDFIDTYFNNTIKTMMAFKWIIRFCPSSLFYLFVDDDFYVSTKNVLRFIRNPLNYPNYLIEADETIKVLAQQLLQSTGNVNHTIKELYEIQNFIDHGYDNTINNKKNIENIKTYLNKKLHGNMMNQKNDIPKNSEHEFKINGNHIKRNLYDIDISVNARLYAGYTFSSSPHRHKWSKWHVNLDEYPWNQWPPYVTGGAIVLSGAALKDMYYASMYTKHFRFDDVYLGLVAMKANIKPLHSNYFHYYKLSFNGPENYQYAIASHGYSDPKELKKIWTSVRSAGYA